MNEENAQEQRDMEHIANGEDISQEHMHDQQLAGGMAQHEDDDDYQDDDDLD